MAPLNTNLYRDCLPIVRIDLLWLLDHEQPGGILRGAQNTEAGIVQANCLSFSWEGKCVQKISSRHFSFLLFPPR